MPAKLPQTIKRDVIQNWLEGYPRNTIAAKYNIAAASVSNIIDEWRNAVGPELANTLRDLSVAMRRSGMSPGQCANGMRIINLFSMMGYDERSAELFLSEVYGRLQELGITPEHIAGYVSGFKSLLDGLNPSISIGGSPMTSLLDIDQIIGKKAEYIRSLEDQSALLENKLRDNRQRVSSSERDLQELLQKKRSTEIDLQLKSDLGDQLQKNGIAVDSISALVEYARFFNQRGFDINELLKTFSNYRKMQDEIAVQGQYLDTLRVKAQEIMASNSVQEGLLQENSLKATEIETIKGMGFGLAELKRLHYILNEISKEAGLPSEENAAVKRFFRELEHYDELVNMGKIIDGRKAELQSLSEAINIASITLNLAPEIVEMVKSLARRGLTKDDLRYFMKYIERVITEARTLHSKDKVTCTESENNSSINTGDFIAKNEMFVGVSEANTDVNQPPDVQIQASRTSAGTGKPRNGQLIKTSSNSKPLSPPRIPKKSLFRGMKQEQTEHIAEARTTSFPKPKSIHDKPSNETVQTKVNYAELVDNAQTKRFLEEEEETEYSSNIISNSKSNSSKRNI